MKGSQAIDWVEHVSGNLNRFRWTKQLTALAFGAALLVGSAALGDSVSVTRMGQVTNLPLPRFVSLKANEGNVRRGPSRSHRIDWVFKRRDMPLRITAEHGHWRRVEDRDGAGGWMHYALLSGVRTVIVEHEDLVLRAQPVASAPAVARFEPGVIARLGRCSDAWCRISAGGYRGWSLKTSLWGVRPDELRD